MRSACEQKVLHYNYHQMALLIVISQNLEEKTQTKRRHKGTKTSSVLSALLPTRQTSNHNQMAASTHKHTHTFARAYTHRGVSRLHHHPTRLLNRMTLPLCHINEQSQLWCPPQIGGDKTLISEGLGMMSCVVFHSFPSLQVIVNSGTHTHTHKYATDRSKLRCQPLGGLGVEGDRKRILPGINFDNVC